MLQQLLDSGQYEVLSDLPLPDRECRSGSIPQVILRYRPEAIECPGCHSSQIRRKGTYKREVIDMWGEKAVDVTIIKQKYLCENPECKKSFHVEDELDYPKEMRISNDVLDAIDTYILQHPNMSTSQIASRFGVGRTVVSQILKRRVQELQEQTVSLHPCILLCFIPFSFHGRECCAVAGIDEHREKYLLNIYRNHSPHLIGDIANKSTHFINDVETCFCKPEPSFIQGIKSEFHGYNCDPAIAILHHCIEKQIQILIKDSPNCHIIGQLDELKRLLGTPNSKKFPNAFRIWCCNLSCEDQTYLKPFIETVDNCLAEYANTTEYDPEETDFSRLLKLIQKFINDNATFDTMLYRLLYSVPSAVTPSNSTVLYHCMNHMYDPVAGSLVDFGVNIDRLYDEILGSRATI